VNVVTVSVFVLDIVERAPLCIRGSGLYDKATSIGANIDTVLVAVEVVGVGVGFHRLAFLFVFLQLECSE